VIVVEKAYFDTSVLVAGCIQGHPQHSAAAALLAAAGSQTRGFLSSHGLAELYAVLTRAPFTPPVYPSEAWQIIEQNVLSRCELVALETSEVADVVRGCARQGWLGGRVYDAIHVRCAGKVACDTLYTLNVKHFQELAPAELQPKIRLP
jgi:predicted nucleic acid-binding protein